MICKIHFRLFFILLIFSLFCSCKEQNQVYFLKNFFSEKWQKDDEVIFTFYNKSPKTKYDLLYQVAYNQDFPYQNIWLKYNFRNPGGKVLIEAKDNLDLFDRISGKPTGEFGAGKMYKRAYFLKNVVLEDTGTFQISIKHYLRLDTLYGISSIGIELVPKP
jgi:gliding motility-associated lipoprotein GldH